MSSTPQNMSAEAPLQVAGGVLKASQLESNGDLHRMRYRYIETRFAQFEDPVAALRNSEKVLHWAQHLLNDGQRSLAVELLQVSLEEEPRQKAVLLFLIELTFLEGNATNFFPLVALFGQQFSDAEDLAIMDAMAHDLVPNDPAYQHITEPLMLRGWSEVSGGEQNLKTQKVLHDALVECIGFHLSR